MTPPAIAIHHARERHAILLPRRRHGTAALLWAALGTLVMLSVLAVRLLMPDRQATASPRAPTPARDTVAPPTPAPVLPPLLIDSASAPSESTATPAAEPAKPESSSAPAAADERRTTTPRRPDAVAPRRAAPRRPPATTRPARSTPRPAPTPPREQRTPILAPPTVPAWVDSARAAMDSAGDARFNSPRITRPWPPPSEEP